MQIVEKATPSAIFCQLWEDDNVLDAPKIARDLAAIPEAAQIPVYAYCKEALSIEAMKQFPVERIVTYKERSELYKKFELLLSK